VLLRNERGALPLEIDQVVAIIGADASRRGWADQRSEFQVSIVDGIREKAANGRDSIRRRPGPRFRDVAVVPSENLHTRRRQSVRGLRGEYFDNNRLGGQPRRSRRRAGRLRWTLNSPARGIPFDWYSARWAGTITIPRSGVRRLGVEGNDGYRLWIDDKLVIDNWRKVSVGRRMSAVNLARGTEHAIRLEYFESTGNARLKLVWDAGVPNIWRAQIDSAFAAAARSDVAVVVAGLGRASFAIAHF
jgi:beta-glucosidase